MRQQTLAAQTGFEKYGRKSKREQFLEEMEQIIPWAELQGLIEPAGPNGVGKTTFAREFLPHFADCKNFVNADLIAQGVAPFFPEAAAFRAGRMMLDEIRSFSKKRESFAFETTLSGRSYLTSQGLRP